MYMGMHFLKAIFMWTMFKVFMGFVTISLLFFFVLVFGHQACENLSP